LANALPVAGPARGARLRARGAFQGVPSSEQLHQQISALRDQPGGDVNVWGSASLVRALLGADLVDELFLMIEPIVLGGGKTIFPGDGEARPFELTSATTAKTGVQIARYRRAR
jgi:dihydrofolate reductase